MRRQACDVCTFGCVVDHTNLGCPILPLGRDHTGVEFIGLMSLCREGSSVDKSTSTGSVQSEGSNESGGLYIAVRNCRRLRSAHSSISPYSRNGMILLRVTPMQASARSTFARHRNLLKSTEAKHSKTAMQSSNGHTPPM
jgi:hypothetical protein